LNLPIWVIGRWADDTNLVTLSCEPLAHLAGVGGDAHRLRGIKDVMVQDTERAAHSFRNK